MEKLQKTITELNDKLKKKNKTPEEQDEEFEQFYECIKDIAIHPVVLRMKLYPHHGGKLFTCPKNRSVLGTRKKFIVCRILG